MPFKVSDVVRRKSAPDKVGVVREVRWHEQTDDCLYRVQFGNGTFTVPEEDLELLPPERDPWGDVVNGRVEGAATFQRLLTFERLSRPATRVAASFGTAKAMLLPYQFKPLLKFLENPDQRLLIADDVGLGKTIEAGYILKELKARVLMERTLCVVPARLGPKWKTEFERRFDETFEIVSRRQLMDGFLEPMRRGAEPPAFQWITSYEAARSPDVSGALAELQPAIDLVVFDEAHRLRNSATQQNNLARVLAECADAFILLTATPIQTGQEDLFQLLKLLDPATFADLDVFSRQLEANRPVVRALRAIRQNPPDAAEAAAELRRLESNPLTQSLAQGPFFESILDRLSVPETLGRHAAVELQRDVSELSVTAHAISRTRKAEVMPNRPRRVALAVAVKLTVEEKRVYDAVAGLAMVMGQGLGWGGAMALITMFRYTASCIPAALEHFRQAAGAGVESLLAALRDDLEGPADGRDEGVQNPIEKFLARLQDVLESRLERDSKLEALLETLAAVWRDDEERRAAKRKVIVFAYFKRTVEYVTRELMARGIVARAIHGGMNISDREAALDEFLTSPDIRVLVSSEVGSEGLDLQQASVVVNYDLPWNPMVVEQRIGRVDRIGQESPVIAVRSLVLENTIEDRILYRLFDRIGIFTETIGEIEPILGERVQELALEALRNELTPQQERQKVEETARAIVELEKQASQLNDGADQLIAGDQAFLDEVESLVGERRVPVPAELFRFLKAFIDQRYPGSQVPEAMLHCVAPVHLQPAAATDLLTAFVGDPDARRLAGRIQQGAFQATMNSDAFLKRPRCEFITAHHHLMRLAKRELEARSDLSHRAFAVRTTGVDGLPAGDYLMAIREYTVSGLRERRELVPVLWSVRQNSPVESSVARRTMVRILDEAESDEFYSQTVDEARATAAEALRKHLDDLRTAYVARETSLGTARAARQRASQAATLQARIRAAHARLEGLRARGAGEFPIRMAEAKIRKEEGRLTLLQQQFAGQEKPRVEEREVAVLHVRVE